jgi:hypothetical protein
MEWNFLCAKREFQQFVQHGLNAPAPVPPVSAFRGNHSGVVFRSDPHGISDALFHY